MAKKLLKYILTNDSEDSLKIESLNVAGLVYDVAETIDELPSKFFSRAISILAQNPEIFALLQNQRKLQSACLDRAIIKVMSSNEMETDDNHDLENCALFIRHLLASNIEENDFSIA